MEFKLKPTFGTDRDELGSSALVKTCAWEKGLLNKNKKPMSVKSCMSFFLI